MKIDDKGKRKAYGHWVKRTGNGYQRRNMPTTVKAKEYMKSKPYCGAFNHDCSDRTTEGDAE